jgi:hypothetical protein
MKKNKGTESGGLRSGAKSGPFAGLRVLDFTCSAAGPYGVSLLAIRYGSDGGATTPVSRPQDFVGSESGWRSLRVWERTRTGDPRRTHARSQRWSIDE